MCGEKNRGMISSKETLWSRCYLKPATVTNFYSASALLAMQSAVLARGIQSVRLSFRHVPVLCPDE